jgi:hypothetical protein
MWVAWQILLLPTHSPDEVQRVRYMADCCPSAYHARQGSHLDAYGASPSTPHDHSLKLRLLMVEGINGCGQWPVSAVGGSGCWLSKTAAAAGVVAADGSGGNQQQTTADGGGGNRQIERWRRTMAADDDSGGGER